MLKKHMLRHVVPVLSAVVLTVSSVCPIQAADSFADIMAEDPEKAISEDSDLIIENAQETEEVLAEDPGTITESWPEAGEVTAEEPEDIIADTSENEALIVEDPVIENTPEEEEMQSAGDSDNSGNVEDPTVEEGEDASYYTDGDGKEKYWTGDTASPFPDVKNSTHAYYQAICWAGNNKIANGYNDGTFRSDRQCTRGEAMMFLWKFMGRPEPKSVSKSPFSDVPKTHAFYKAILWASQKGIAKGYADGKFGINRKCTRGHAMMFLWRAAGKPQYKVPAVSPFTDVSVSHSYYEAILWGRLTGITNGYADGTFGINQICTRGQIATFLYRFFLSNFYTVTMQNGKTLNISSPVTKKKSGNYATILTADKTTVTVPTVPGKTLFVGNSLLQGLGSAQKGGRFGMCASDSKHDYYYLVTRAILRKNSRAKFSKLSGTAFEGSTDLNTAGKWYTANKSYFENDLDLIIIQLGDNVNDNGKKAAFRENIRHLLAQIKSDCPKARVICVGTWYDRPTVISDYHRACKENGCDFVSIEGLLSATTMPPSGTVITFNDGTTAVATGGSLIHPNDYGMELIAQRVIAQLKL